MLSAEGPTDLSGFMAALRQLMPWREQGLCRRAGRRREWFTVGEDRSVTFAGAEVSGRQAQTLAVQKYCIDCDVQWQCALHAITAEEECGVWSVTTRDLLWLQRCGFGDLLVEAAQEDAVPVHVAVRRARRAVRESDPQCEIVLVAA